VAARVVDAQAASAPVPPPPPNAAAGPALDASVVRRLEIMADAMAVSVVADPTVDLVHIAGPLEVEQDGEVLHLRPPTRDPDGNVYRFGPIGGLMAGWVAGRENHRAVVRVRPDLALSISASAGRLDLYGMQGGFTVRMAAGKLTAREVRGPFDVDLTSAAAKIAAVVDIGSSTIRGQMSNLDLVLLPGSDVVVTAESEMGSVKIDGANHKGKGSGMHESGRTVVGAGAARLDVSMQMGNIKVATR
jgi:hypothetical protein